MADEAENTPTVGTEETQGGTETAQTVWPDFGYPEERDAIDALIEALNAETGEVLTFERDALDNLMIRSGETVLLNKRTAASADDLMAGPGLTTVEYTADASCSVIFSARGRWA